MGKVTKKGIAYFASLAMRLSRILAQCFTRAALIAAFFSAFFFRAACIAFTAFICFSDAMLDIGCSEFLSGNHFSVVKCCERLERKMID
mmetsp:Transcript_32490/g.59736  ORF Transcript_32490/g.59736 Transcript_32490/m.59736 type:complete len:89 (-) Transcript_32490:24-290(-)